MTPESSKAKAKRHRDNWKRKAEKYLDALENIDDALSRRWNDRKVLIRRIGEMVDEGLKGGE